MFGRRNSLRWDPNRIVTEYIVALSPTEARKVEPGDRRVAAARTAPTVVAR